MKSSSKYLCILGGGSVRGYAYIGVLRAFKELGFYPQKLAGSSVGAVLSVLSVLDIPLNEIEKILFTVNFELFRDINFKFSPAFSISKGGVFTEWMREIIEKYYYKENYNKDGNKPVCFKDLAKDLIIMTTDIKNAEPFIFSKETTPDYEIAQAVRASIGFPGFLSPIEYNDKLLADGDLMKNIPCWKLNKTLCPNGYNILEVRLEGIKKENTIKNFVDYFNTIYSCITNYSTDYIIDTYAQREKYNYIKINTEDLLLVNFNLNNNEKHELIELGYKATIKFFKKELNEKRKILGEYYLSLLTPITQLENNIIKRDYKKAKINFGDIFIILADIKKFIDSKIAKKIKKTKNLFYDNLYTGLLGQEKIKNRKELKITVAQLKEDILQKINDLEDFEF